MGKVKGSKLLYMQADRKTGRKTYSERKDNELIITQQKSWQQQLGEEIRFEGRNGEMGEKSRNV